MAGYVISRSTKFEDPTAIRSWVISSDIPYRIPLPVRLQPLRMRRITWPMRSGKFSPHIWNPWPRFANSLYNFFGATIKINGVIAGKTVYGPVLKTTQLSAHAQNHASPERCRKPFCRASTRIHYTNTIANASLEAPFTVRGCGLVQADLLDLTHLARCNDGSKLVLTAIDVFASTDGRFR